MTDVIDAFKQAIENGEARTARESAELSQTDVADVLGISPAAISRWESGSRVPREDLAAQYLAVIGVTVAQDDGDCPEGQHRMPDGSCMENDVHPTGDRYEVSGVAVMEGQWTGDGRQFAKGGLSWPDPAETNIPLQWQKESSHGGDHDVTVNVGRITGLERDGDAIRATAVVDGGSDDGAEVIRRMTMDPPTIAGISIVADDPDNGDIEIVFDGDDPLGVLFHTGRIRAGTLVDIPAFVEGALSINPITANMTDAEIFGNAHSIPVTLSLNGQEYEIGEVASVDDVPALLREAADEARTFGPTGKSVSSASWSGSTGRFTDEQYRMSAAGCDSSLGSTPKETCFLPHHEPGGAVNRAGVHNAAARANQVQASAESVARAKAHLRSHYTRDLNEDPPEALSMSTEEIAMASKLTQEEADTVMGFGHAHYDDGSLAPLRAIVAAASTITISDAPPAEWFDEPSELPAAGAITVTGEGRIFGLLAPKDVAHRAFRDKRITVPTGNVDYSRWMNRETITASGERISTGPITMQCGHASTSPLFRSNPDNAMQHYDNSCSIVATARIGENKHGVWIAGALLPDVDRAQVARMMACQLSGDWQDHRESPGMREFTAALMVPVPGFPVGDTDPSIRMSDGLLVASASPVSWFASGNIPDDESDSDVGDDIVDLPEVSASSEADVERVSTPVQEPAEPESGAPELDPDPGPQPDAADDTSGSAGAPDIVIEDLPSPDEAKQARQAAARERIAAMRKDLGLEDE